MYEVRDWPSLGDIQRASWRKGLARSNAGRECAGKRWHSSSSLSVQLQGRFFLPTPSLHLRAQASPNGCPKSGGLNSWRQAQGLDLRVKWLAVPRHVCTSRLPWPLSHCSLCGSWLLSPGFPPSCFPVEVGEGMQSLGRSGSGGEQPTPLSPRAQPSSLGFFWAAPPCSQAFLGTSISQKTSRQPTSSCPGG